MGTKSGNMAIVYSSIAVLSLLLLIGYLLWEKKKTKHMMMLFASVAVANIGYFLQSVSGTLNGALWANRISYLGSAYLILLMLLIIMDVCQVERKPWMKGTLIAVSTAAFLLAASGGWNSLYYKAVAVVEINGMTRLVKEYGPLHMLYPVYLLSYFVMMVSVIGYAAKNRKLASPKYAVFLACVVLLNIGVWAVEQVINVDFEFLSVSYIVAEVSSRDELMLYIELLRCCGRLGELTGQEMTTE